MFQHFHFEAFAFGIAHIHAIQHARPVFRFGAACACHDVDEAVVAVGFLVEHALEFQIGHALFQHGDVFLYACKRFQIGFFYGHFQQHAAVVYACADFVQIHHDAFKQFAFFADFLGFFRVVPQFWVFRQTHHFF